MNSLFLNLQNRLNVLFPGLIVVGTIAAAAGFLSLHYKKKRAGLKRLFQIQNELSRVNFLNCQLELKSKFRLMCEGGSRN